MKKKRGGQPNNKNAFNHGFYSSAFKAKENRLLNESSVTDVSAEIELLRVMNIRYLESIKDSSHQLDPEKRLADLRAFTLSSRALSSLIRIQRIRTIEDTEADEILEGFASLPDDEVDDGDTAP
jgi:hypothetical protein